jgi:hypothetical protein
MGSLFYLKEIINPTYDKKINAMQNSIYATMMFITAILLFKK